MMLNYIKFCDNCPVYSYGNDWEDVIVDNINLYSNRFPNEFNYDYLLTFGKNSFNIKNYFKAKGIDTSKYTSGTVYKSMDIQVDNSNNHFAIFDCLSIFMTINALNN